MRQKLTFTQAAIRRAIEGARSAGLNPNTVEIRPDGSVLISEAIPTETKKSNLDRWLEQNGAHTP